MLIIDHSQMDCFANCPMQYYLKYVLGIVKEEYGIESMDTSFGSAVHKGMEHYYGMGRSQASLDAAVRAFAGLYEDIPGEDCKTLTNGVKLFEMYANYDKQNFSDWEVLDTEKLVSFQLSPKILYVGKVDLVIRWRDNIYVVDFKTTATRNIQQYLGSFQLSYQPTGYIEWCKGAMGSCSGFIPVVLQMGFRKRAYKGEPAGYWLRPDFTVVNRTQAQIDKFKADMEFYAQLIEECKEKDFWAMHPSHCSAFRGCQYKPICESVMDENVINTLYVKADTVQYLGDEFKELVGRYNG